VAGQRTGKVKNSVGEDGRPEGNVMPGECTETRERNWDEDKAVCDLLMQPEQ